ncbi:MAG: hypothetical protein JSS98_09470, partial [Bacteroidetes bacterium]|nr:hypothetical protein [Bacteroidota bacterium]
MDDSSDDELSENINDCVLSANVDSDEPKLKTKKKIDEIHVIKCKLKNVIKKSKGYKLRDIIKEHVCRTNKIILEGIYLFNIYILYILEYNKPMTINKSTIRRCARLLLDGAGDSRLTGNVDEDILIKLVRDKYFEFPVEDRKHDFSCDENSLMKPVEATCDSYLTNLKLHIGLNFKRYQKRYLMSKLTKYVQLLLGEERLNDCKFILYAVQQHINGNTKFSYRTDERLNRYNQLFEKFKLNGFIEQETKILKEHIKFNIESGQEISAVSDEKIFYYLRYFCVLLKELTVNNIKKFSLIPHFAPKNRHIHFEARSLCVIYNKWKNEKIKIKDFEKNYKKYFDKMFTTKKRFRKMLKKYPDIRSISTDGYSISIGFQKLKTVKFAPKTKKSPNEPDNKPKQKTKPIEKPIKKTEKEPEKEPLDFETEYNNLPKNTEKIFEVNDIRTTEDFLNKFNIAGCDPGNAVMLDISFENGLHFTIHKNYYNDLAHVTRNKILLDEETEKKGMNEIYSEMALETTKTTSIDEYMKYVKTVRRNWDRIWDFCTSQKITSLKFDSHVYKDKAISRIAKEIVSAAQDQTKVYKR